MIVRRGDDYLGVLGLTDTARSSQRRHCPIRELGIRRMIMLSGDNQTAASAIAKKSVSTKPAGDLIARRATSRQ